MVNYVYVDTDGHKRARRITSREEYFKIRNSAKNKENFAKARAGDDQAKRRLVQFNYNAQLPDGLLAGCKIAASTYCIDIDCDNEEQRHETAQRILQHKDETGLLELSKSPHGLHAVCRRTLGKTILENQIKFALTCGVEMDCNAHDLQRILFTGTADEENLLFLDDAIFEEPLSEEEGREEFLRLKEREENGMEELPANYKKGEKHYRPWEEASEPVEATTVVTASEDATDKTQTLPQQGDDAGVPMVFGHPVVDYINLMLPDGAPKGQRHTTMLRLANDLIILLDNNPKLVKRAATQLGWVKSWLAEPGADSEVDDIINSAKKLLKKRESETFYSLRPSKDMVAAIESVTRQSYSKLVSNVKDKTAKGTDGGMEMLRRMGSQLKRFAIYFSLLKLLFHGHKLLNFPALLFVGGGFCTPLMTRCWYSFYGSPGRKCRLNSLVMLIGKFGGLKGFAVKLYDLLMECVKKSDQNQIDALNKWNLEREQNNGSRMSSSARPSMVYRCLPAESSAAAIREAEFNCVEEIDGEKWPLHTFVFDSELNNTLEIMKKSHMDAFRTLWLKSFHNEWGGSLLKTSSSPVGEFRIHFNCVYSGTFDAFEKIANESTYSSGVASRFATVLMGPTNYEMMEYVEPTDEDKLVEEQLREWGYKLDAMKGEIPTTELSKALYKWTSRKMDEAREEQSEVLEDLCKRPAWYGISLALPFIISRHWGEMVQDEDGRFRCGAGFKMDKHDIDLALFIAQAQYDFQQYFYYEIGQKVHDKMSAKQFGKKLQTRTQLAFMRLPEVFTSSDVMREYGYDNSNSVNSCLKRLKDEGRIIRMRSGENKGKFRKVV